MCISKSHSSFRTRSIPPMSSNFNRERWRLTSRLNFFAGFGLPFCVGNSDWDSCLTELHFLNSFVTLLMFWFVEFLLASSSMTLRFFVGLPAFGVPPTNASTDGLLDLCIAVICRDGCDMIGAADGVSSDGTTFLVIVTWFTWTAYIASLANWIE